MIFLCKCMYAMRQSAEIRYFKDFSTPVSDYIKCNSLNYYIIDYKYFEKEKDYINLRFWEKRCL